MVLAMNETQKNIIRQRAIEAGLNDAQKNLLENALNDGVIYLIDESKEPSIKLSSASGDSETAVNIRAVREFLSQFDTNKNADNLGIIDSNDFPGTAQGNGTGATDLYASFNTTSSEWIKVREGVYVNTSTKQVYIGDDAEGEISIREILEGIVHTQQSIQTNQTPPVSEENHPVNENNNPADNTLIQQNNNLLPNGTDFRDYTVIVDDDNGNVATIKIDCKINELIIDNDMLTGGGVAEAKVEFTEQGAVNSIWNDVDAVKADINTSITGINISANIRNTNDLDISETLTASEAHTTTAKIYNVTRTLERSSQVSDSNPTSTQQTGSVLQNDLNISGNITITGNGTQIANPTFGRNVQINVTQNQNFNDSVASQTKVNLNDVKMKIDNINIDTVSANAMNAGNIFSLNLDSNGEGEVIYGITGKVSQEITKCTLGDEKTAPAPRRCDPYNILEINVDDNARVSKTNSSINLERNQKIENVTLGKGVGINVASKLDIPFINGTYIDQEFFGSATKITGSQKMSNINNQSADANNKAIANLQIRNENIWLSNGETEAKYRTMSFKDVQALPENKFFRGGSQSVSGIKGQYEALNNGKDAKSTNTQIKGIVDVEELRRRIRAAFAANSSAAFSTIDTSKDGSVSVTELKNYMIKEGATSAQATTLAQQIVYQYGGANATGLTEEQFASWFNSSSAVNPPQTPSS